MFLPFSCLKVGSLCIYFAFSYGVMWWSMWKPMLFTVLKLTEWLTGDASTAISIWTLNMVPWVPEVFSRVRRGAFGGCRVGRRPTCLRPKAEETSGEAARKLFARVTYKTWPKPRMKSLWHPGYEHGWINSFIEVPYHFQALRKYSLEDFNSALTSLLPRNYKHHVFLG